MIESNSELFIHSVCRQTDPDLWTDEREEARAIHLCWHGGPGGGECPARQACLDLATNPKTAGITGDGVWGGVNRYTRGKIRAARARADAEDRNQTVTFTATNCRTRVSEFYS